MGKKKSITLTSSNLRDLAKTIEKDYQKELLDKAHIYIGELLKVGIKVAREKLDENGYGNYVTLTKTITDGTNTTLGIMYATNVRQINSEWVIDDSGNTMSAVVSPILMAEFGAGATKAKNPLGVVGVGAGTFPTNQKGARDTWYYRLPGEEYIDENGNVRYIWHVSHGIKPTQPIYNAIEEMKREAHAIRKRVFG